MNALPSQSAPVAHAINNESIARAGGCIGWGLFHNPLRKGGSSTDWARTAALPWLAGQSAVTP